MSKPAQTRGRESDTDLQGKSWWLLVSTVLAMLWALYQDSGDPFGLDTFLETLSANTYTAITSPFYGQRTEIEIEGKPYHSRRGQSQIIVLLLDDNYLQKTGQTWPIAPDKYRSTLRKLAQADAAAVFFDIYFAPGGPDKSRRIEKLMQAVNQLEQRASTQFFFAGTLRDTDLSRYSQTPPKMALAQMTGAQNIYPLAQATSGGNVVDTAGWAVYKAWCQREANKAQCPGDIAQSASIDPMYLLWGFAPNDIMTKLPEFGGRDCVREDHTLAAMFASSLEIFAWLATAGYHQPSERDSSGAVRNTIAPCPYHTQVNMMLFNSLSYDELTTLFRDKIVILGTALKLHPDYQVSPLHGYVPGAFWHATAADNLIEFGKGYLREAGDYEQAEQVGIVLLILINAVLSLLIIQIDRRNAANNRQIDQLHIAHGVFVFCAISATVLWFVWHNRVSPANWIGMALLMLMIAGDSLAALWRRCCALLPIPIAEPNLSAAVNGLKGLILSLLALSLCLLLFLLPQGLFLARVSYANTLCWTILFAFGFTALFSVYTIVKQWRN
jgi:CHASE2 domain-containing sensor protein